MVGDNETVVIGGLISDVYDDSESKIPGSATFRSSAGPSRALRATSRR